MTYKDLLDRLSKITPDEYEFEAKIFLENFTDKTISYIKIHPDFEIYSDSLENALRKREEHIPLQYIIGKWDFYRQTYIVNENCLIPRSDTEVLVEKSIELLPKDAYFIDLCTGSGCIAISTLCERNDTTAVMVDKFPKTLELAKENAELNCVSHRVKPMLFDVLNEEKNLDGMKFDAIISNPPYIRPEVIQTLTEEVKKEPYAALNGGEDGLIFYNKILADYSIFLKEDGFYLFEIGYDQGESLCELANKYNLVCKIIKDYSGNDRVAYIKK